jgi:hypothetical protein
MTIRYGKKGYMTQPGGGGGNRGTGPYANDLGGTVTTAGDLQSLTTMVGDTFHSSDNKIYRCTSLSGPLQYAVYTYSTTLSGPASGILIASSGLVLYLDANVVASYPGTGATWTDLSGLGNNATLNGSPAWSAGSFAFPASQSVYAACNSFNGFPTGAAPFTASVWAKNLNVYSTNSVHAWGNNGAEPSVTVTLGQNGAWYTTVKDTTGSYITVSSYSNPVNVTQWHNGAVTYDGTTLKLYLDGVLRDTAAAVLNTPAITTAAIARVQYYDSLYGSISSVALYNRALSAAEVAANYNALAPYNV